MNTARRCAVVFSAVLMLWLAGAGLPSSAQEMGFFAVGLRAGVSVDPEQAFVGLHFDLGELTEHLLLRPDLEIGFGDDETVYAAGAQVLYFFPRRWKQWEPYAGGEIGVNHREIDEPRGVRDPDETGLALNAVGGIETELEGGNRFLVELKLGLAEEPRLKLLVGWTF